MGRVEGKVAIVTGAALGIGMATARLLAREGAAVAVLDVRDEEGRTVADGIQKHGGRAAYWHVDVSNEQQVESSFREVQGRFGRIDVLVNNAGISGVSKPTHEITQEEWDRVQAVNVKGVFLCTKHAVPYLKRQGGSIVNLSSIYGIVGAADAPPYHASKGAVRLMAKTDALLYAGDGIRVNSVHPGFIWTPMVEDFARRSSSDVAAFRKQLDALHPIGHVGEADDVAYGILYLASDESRFVTGTELIIDGGYTAR